ncbi:thiamine pyrophosphate-dependent dehydrogenase E1 component subunit alpha [Novosphingobium flavum]|uniref:Thiamine pyrophosphate-dependent dehydrogenase E1 component subunit alpha n=1 Tax=Novosphingobium flavum TaxID=1778672 RepID=A0A7X1KLE9_9SPHN|nr:thiamine pyrophosphate-dependent dehydrogenase E1 component subunit alpha [Novosphingobium flavum]MBC2665160.1 thiamine pyrophosphate-dependent dehydrogenase E1 component subunit alpha [Novosphingobium flavum]
MTDDPIGRLRAMLLIRAFEDGLSARKAHGFQLLSSGEEAVAVALASALTADDQLLTGGRSIGPALARGVNPGMLMAELLGKTAGMNRGRAGRGHFAAPEQGFFGSHAVVGGNISVAAGVALARKMAGEPGIVAILFGDGASAAGALYETLNIAALWELPILFVCNNNQLSVSTPREASNAARRICDVGAVFGMPARSVDGLDMVAAAAAAREAAEHVRSGRGPAFLEMSSIRLRSHSTTARETRSRDELASLRLRCPIEREIARLQGEGLLGEMEIAGLREEALERARAAMVFADASPYPDPAEVLADVD